MTKGIVTDRFETKTFIVQRRDLIIEVEDVLTSSSVSTSFRNPDLVFAEAVRVHSKFSDKYQLMAHLVSTDQTGRRK